VLVTEVNHILALIERPDFLACTYTASDHQTVAAIIRDMWECKYLLENKQVNFPLLLARYQEEEANMADETRLIYFILFQIYQDEAAIPELVSYLVSCRSVVPREKVKFFSPWHPFFHAAKALEILSHQHLRVPTGNEVLNDLDTFLGYVMRWSMDRTVRRRRKA
jgi:hypothetical protein